MSRKKLLTEAEIRQFMKLAKLPVVGAGRINELALEDEEPPEGLGVEVPPEAELPPEEELSPEGELDVEPGAEGADMIPVDDFLDALDSALEDVMKEPVSIERDTEEEEEEDIVEPDMDLEAEEEEEAGLGVPPGPEMGAPLEEEALVAEVARRVAARLMNDKKNNDLASQLAERIFNKITKR